MSVLGERQAAGRMVVSMCPGDEVFGVEHRLAQVVVDQVVHGGHQLTPVPSAGLAANRVDHAVQRAPPGAAADIGHVHESIFLRCYFSRHH